jgi:leucyl aminopeptidase
MPIRLRTGDVARLGVDLAVYFAFQDDASPLGVADASLRRKLAAAMKAEGFAGRPRDLLDWNANGKYRARRFLVVGLGARGGPLQEIVGDAAARAARASEKFGARSMGIAMPPAPEPEIAGVIRSVAEGARLGAYRYDRYINDPARKSAGLRVVEIAVAKDGTMARRAVRAGQVTARAVALARDLVNEPPSVLTPTEMAKRAMAEAKLRGLAAETIGVPALRRLGMRTLLAVGQGSSEPPCCVHLRYRPENGKPSAKIALIGKGVTFDSGGLNLKPGASMLTMKGDMSGAAAVLAAMSTLRETGCTAEVHGFLGLVENMIGGGAFKPGDIVRTLSGKTVEIQDTDAEGRLVLCDLLAHAAASVRPDRMIDVATLTGAIVVALGKRISGVFSRHDDLRDEILRCGRDAGEKLWPLPMEEDYLEHLQEGPADLRNVGDRWGGAIQAALFLGEFVPRSLPWVHLDIAGTAFLERSRSDAPAGGTGAGVRTLIRWLERS